MGACSAAVAPTVQIGALAAVLLVAAIAVSVFGTRPAPTRRAGHTTPTVLQRFHTALMDAVSGSVLKIDNHGVTVWVHNGAARSVSSDCRPPRSMTMKATRSVSLSS